MKKIISSIIVFIMVLSLVSCNRNKEEIYNENIYKVVEVGGFDNAPSDELAHNFEFFFKVDYIVDESKQSKTKKFKINGEKLIFEYEQTKKGYLYNDEIDIYVCTDDDQIEVEYDSKKKEIRAIRNAYINGAKKEEKSYEECVEIARNEMKKYTDDADSYTLIDDGYSSDSSVYHLEFVRVLGGVKTKDRAIFEIDWCGNISSFVLRSWESMKNAEYPGEDEMKVIESKISEKVDSIFAPVKNKYIITCMDESTEIDFMRLADGSYVLVYYLNFLLTSVSDPGFKDSESCVLMIYC